jgi:hypothetical protein
LERNANPPVIDASGPLVQRADHRHLNPVHRPRPETSGCDAVHYQYVCTNPADAAQSRSNESCLYRKWNCRKRDEVNIDIVFRSHGDHATVIEVAARERFRIT